MILAIDPGIARCGWAIVEPGNGRVEACGVIVTERDRKASASVDRARRSRQVAEALDDLVTTKPFTIIAGEEPLGFGPIRAVASQIAVWGLLVDIANAHRLDLHEVTAKVWQHAVMPEASTEEAKTKRPRARRVGAAKAKAKRRPKIDYKQLEAKLAAYMGREALAHIPKPDRTHALDAVGVGVLVALRPELATVI